jgi:hypothetical protein
MAVIQPARDTPPLIINGIRSRVVKDPNDRSEAIGLSIDMAAVLNIRAATATIFTINVVDVRKATAESAYRKAPVTIIKPKPTAIDRCRNSMRLRSRVCFLPNTRISNYFRTNQKRIYRWK